MFNRVALVILLMICGVSLKAQFKKGDKMVGASVGALFFNNESTDLTSDVGTTNTSSDKYGFTINPSIGWFVTDNLAVGVTPVFDYTHQKTVGTSSNGSTFLKNENNQYAFGLGGFGRYYFNTG